MPDITSLSQSLVGRSSGKVVTVPASVGNTPTTGDFASNTWGLSYDSDTGAKWLAWNRGGTQENLLFTNANTRMVVASGNATTDLARWDAAITELTALGGGRLIISGLLLWASGTSRALNSSIDLVADYPGSGIDGQHTGGGSDTVLYVGGSAESLSGGTSITGGLAQWTNHFASPGSLVAGDTILLYSEDAIAGDGSSGPDHTAHASDSDRNCPAQILRVAAIDGTDSRVLLDGPVVDPMTSSCSFKELTMYRCNVSGLLFTRMLVTAGRLLNSTFRDCRWDDCSRTAGATGMSVQHCHGVSIIGGSIDNEVDGGIGISVGTSTSTLIEGMHANGSGHFVTTTAGGSAAGSPNKYYGTPVDTVIRGNTVHQTRNRGVSTAQALDSHAYGFGVTFTDNVVITSGYRTTAGNSSTITPILGCCQIRSRQSVIARNTFIGQTGSSVDCDSTGIVVTSARGAKLLGNVYLNMGIGIQLIDKYGGHTISGEVFDRVHHCGIRVSNTQSLTITDQQRTLIHGCVGRVHDGDSYGGGTDPYPAWISNTIRAAPLDIVNCYFPKSGATNSIRSHNAGESTTAATRVLNCTLMGYGSGDDGIPSDNGIDKLEGNITD